MERHARSRSLQELRVRPPSLAISPNLQALLEHDERVRAGNFFGHVESPTSSSTSPATGLPPPPRGPRKLQSCPPTPLYKPGSSETLAQDTRSSSSSVGASSPNPFINSPPTLDDAFLAKLENLVISPAFSSTSSFPSQTRASRATSNATSTQSFIRDQPKPGSEESPTSRPDFRRSLRLILPHREPTEGTAPNAHRASWASFMGKSALLFTSSPDDENSQRRPRPTSSTSVIPRSRRLSKLISSSWKEMIGGDEERRRFSTARSGSAEDESSGTINAVDRETTIRRTQSQLTGSCLRHNPRFSHAFAVSPAISGDLAQPPPSNNSEPHISENFSSPYNADSSTTYHSLTWSTEDMSTPLASFMEMQSPTSPRFDTLLTTQADTPIPPPDITVRSAISSTSSKEISVKSGAESTPVARNTSSRTLGHGPSTRSTPEASSRTALKSLTTSQDTAKSTFFDAPPPTTNYLNAQERSELVKKSRKLAKVFGQTPGAMSLRTAPQEPLPPTNSSTHRHWRGAASISNDLPASAFPLLENAQDSSMSARRHSTPLNPEHIAFLRERPSPEASRLKHRIDTGSHERLPSSSPFRKTSPDSPTSFIDLSQEEDFGSSDAYSTAAQKSSRKSQQPRAPPQSPSPSLTPEELAEADRRKKREKLAKLHRFLGSRVPTELVLGLPDHVGILPAPALSPTSPHAMPDDEGERKAWLRRRRSSSAAALGVNWGGELERLKEDLGSKEKAIIVRRAQKMEKVFGVPPPQTLYQQTRHVFPPSVRTSPAGASGEQHSPASPLDSTGSRSFNQSASKKVARNDYLEAFGSGQGFLRANGALEASGRMGQAEGPVEGKLFSNVYSDYQHSLKSLVDIIDRDDKQSLAELHQYLTEDGEDDQAQETARRLSVSSSIRSERRHSLPPRASMISLNSNYSLEPQIPLLTDFQLRRRRAAKLTQFFGVDYRELIDDVLDSIEKGVEEERKKGTINPDEFEDLLRSLRDLKTKRGGI